MPPGSTAFVFGVHPFVVDSVEELRGVLVAIGRLGGVHRASVELEFLTATPTEKGTIGAPRSRLG